ncbi:hypothetical protein DPEC_G00013300 [Dallia pectoralis]|uniref:Uncharacterized protein n=1 Tax=Dallia pectoralis TaxID=75939 RepID=A0ACC2HLX0_DALPE|nr:hypothetical protein DPEC_G00013300 [Dallia pectoralis]
MLSQSEGPGLQWSLPTRLHQCSFHEQLDYSRQLPWQQQLHLQSWEGGNPKLTFPPPLPALAPCARLLTRW